uniref:Ig-like domain-containing protein n=1 Tax=Glossina austeni TaxID=7395 RepID=A0A1A9USK3_GLOAU
MCQSLCSRLEKIRVEGGACGASTIILLKNSKQCIMLQFAKTNLQASTACLSSPPPTVTWLMNGQLQNSIVDYTYDGTINSKLVVRNLSRIHQHAVYTCQASNFHKKYVSTNITIELYCNTSYKKVPATIPSTTDEKLRSIKFLVISANSMSIPLYVVRIPKVGEYLDKIKFETELELI